MNTNELIKLANVADKDGDLELADFIDRELLAMSNNKNIREAVDLGKYTRPFTDTLGKIPEFFGAGKYRAPLNWSKPAVDLATSNPNISGNAFQKALGSINKEINLDANQVKNLETTLIQQMQSSIGQADVPTVKALEKLVNKEFSKLTIADKELIAKYARETGIVGRRTDADFTDILDLVSGRPLQVRPRTVQRVNPNAKLIGGLGALALAPTMYNTFAGQGPDTTGSAIPTGPAGMPQLGPGMGGMSGGNGGYGGPQAGGDMGNFAPTQPTGLGYANTMMDPTSKQRGESGGYAPTSGYTGRSEREINPSSKYRTNEVGMMRGEPAPVYNNYSAGYNPGTQTSVAPVAEAQPLDSITPVAVPTAQELSGQPGFGGATDTAGIAKELAGDPDAPETPPMTPAQIQEAMNPLTGVGY
jgi:hypothetical protein